ncbi:hypothetical protein D9M68_709060 [compost metagenome]
MKASPIATGMSFDTNFFNGLAITGQYRHIAREEICQHRLKLRVQLWRPRSEQNLGIVEGHFQGVTLNSRIPARQIRPELINQVVVDRHLGILVSDSDLLDVVPFDLHVIHIGHGNEQKHHHQPGHQVRDTDPVLGILFIRSSAAKQAIHSTHQARTRCASSA